MANELVRMTAEGVLATGEAASLLPVLVERAGGAARFAWDEFFYAEHHNPHTQRAYLRAVKAFLVWCEGQGAELARVTPGMVGQYLVGLGGSPAKRNLALAALRGFFDRLVQRHVVILNPAAALTGRKFGAKLTSRGFTLKESNGKCYRLGIRLKGTAEPTCEQNRGDKPAF
jgi:hypothetical protein